MGFDKEALFKDRITEAEVELPGMGVVRVRGLTRAEVLMAQRGKDLAAQEQRIVAAGMVDPELTVDEVRRWQEHSPAGELDKVTEKIRDLSGLGETAEKEAYASFRDEPDHGGRVLSGGEAIDDGGDSPGDHAER